MSKTENKHKNIKTEKEIKTFTFLIQIITFQRDANLLFPVKYDTDNCSHTDWKRYTKLALINLAYLDGSHKTDLILGLFCWLLLSLYIRRWHSKSHFITIHIKYTTA